MNHSIHVYLHTFHLVFTYQAEHMSRIYVNIALRHVHSFFGRPLSVLISIRPSKIPYAFRIFVADIQCLRHS